MMEVYGEGAYVWGRGIAPSDRPGHSPWLENEAEMFFCFRTSYTLSNSGLNFGRAPYKLPSGVGGRASATNVFLNIF